MLGSEKFALLRMKNQDHDARANDTFAIPTQPSRVRILLRMSTAIRKRNAWSWLKTPKPVFQRVLQWHDGSFATYRLIKTLKHNLRRKHISYCFSSSALIPSSAMTTAFQVKSPESSSSSTTCVNENALPASKIWKWRNKNLYWRSVGLV